MDHKCYRCGAEVPEGSAFCSSCGAPQIRVNQPDDEAATPPLPPGTPGDVPPPQIPVGMPPPIPSRSSVPPSYQVPQQWRVPEGIAGTQRPFDWSKGLPSALLAGGVTGLLSLLPYVGCLTCFWMLAAGAIAVMVYRKRVADALLTAGVGAKLGALAGLFAFVITVIGNAIKWLINPAQFRAAMEAGIQDAISRQPEANQAILQSMLTPGFVVIFTLALLLIAFALLGTIGGAVTGASVSNRPR